MVKQGGILPYWHMGRRINPASAHSAYRPSKKKLNSQWIKRPQGGDGDAQPGQCITSPPTTNHVSGVVCSCALF